MNQGSCVALESLAVIQEECENNRKRKIDNSFAAAVQAISRRVLQSVEQKTGVVARQTVFVLFYLRKPD